MDETTKPVTPQTLVEAHEALARIRPGRQAPLAEWLAYYQRSAALYAGDRRDRSGTPPRGLSMAERERKARRKSRRRSEACESWEMRAVGEDRDAGAAADVDAGS